MWVLEDSGGFLTKSPDHFFCLFLVLREIFFKVRGQLKKNVFFLDPRAFPNIEMEETY